KWLALGDNTGLSVIEVSAPAHVYHLHNLPGGDGRFMPRWSPDGSKIAFLHCCPKPYRREPYPNGLGTTADISLVDVYVASMASPTTVTTSHELGVTYVGVSSGRSWASDDQALCVYRYS